MTEKSANTISGLFLLSLSLVMGIWAQTLPKTITDPLGSSFAPTLFSIGLGMCGAAIAIQARRSTSGARMPGWTTADKPGAIRIAVVAAATAAYNILLEPLGYLIVTFLYLLFLLLFMKVKWLTALIISLVAALGTYAVFAVWLKIYLPMGLIEIYF